MHAGLLYTRYSRATSFIKLDLNYRSIYPDAWAILGSGLAACDAYDRGPRHLQHRSVIDREKLKRVREIYLTIFVTLEQGTRVRGISPQQ
jgi:hypothetical protein